VAYDRFGNPYLASELTLTQQGLCPNAGFFVLDYTNIGSFTADEQNTICQVFYDLSNLIQNPDNVLIEIKITKTLLDTDVGATGTPLFTPGCGIGYPQALARIKGLQGTAALTASGTLDINSFFTWHTLNNDPLLPGSNLPDLYSAVLHEALHILGVGSLISTMDTPITGSYYSNWDLSLKTESGTPLIVPGVGPGMELECCDQHKFNPELASSGQVSSFLSGLEMWRGIVVQKGGGVKMEHCRVADAQYAVKAHPAENGNEPIAELTILGNDFDNNFVGLLIPQTPYAKINAVLSRNVFSGFDELKHPYTGQSAAPESLPEQNQRALAGMVVNNLGAFSSYDNRFEQLTSGIVNRGSNLTAHLNNFADIQTNETLYPAFAPAGIALANYAAGHNVVAATDNTFNDCPMGILANLCELKATGNTLDYVDRGIWASLSGAGGIAIDNNEMAHTQVGILVAHAHAAGQVSITGNTVKTEAAGNGTGIITLYNHAPAVVENNAVTVGKAGLGISIYAGKGAQLLENNVILADQNLAGAGISLTYAQQCLLQDNAITGAGLGGPGNIGIEIVASPGNVYCCNTVGNTRLGVSVSGGSLATDNFRGTTFGNHATSLYLPDVNAVLGSQSHTQNKWTGTGAAVYGAPFNIAQLYPFTIDITPPNGSPDNEPVSHSPTGWFAYDENPTTSTACDPSVCMTPLFYSESDDVKRIAGGDTSLSPVTLWELQRYIYAGLTGQYVQHAGILSFLSQSDTSSIGTFHNLDRRLAESFQIDTAVSPELQAIFYHTNEKMESLKSIDQFLLQADSVQTIEALESRKVVVNDLYELSEQQQNLIQVLENNVTSAANGLSDENEGILATTIFEINTKTLNAIYFKYLASSDQMLDSTDIAVLQTIAFQCPATGGNAVYKARALLMVIMHELSVYDDQASCSQGQALIVPTRDGHDTNTPQQRFLVFPNPAKDNIQVTWLEAAKQSGQVVLSDIYGRPICRKTIPLGSNSCVLSLQGASNGLYILHIDLDGIRTAEKIVVKY
jgi:hypothetical protein